ncbi:ParB/RepB/Spo0J family partition protein [Streptomyces sp. NPDC018584]|uniref:ParB/RepB/Spo0J family partition protein n=1 Tax=unclassified Streptomyces TaxID=2593676 RepID=UPI0037BB8AF0
MRKADDLGGSAAFGAAAGARSSRRNTFDSTIGGAHAAAAAVTDLPLTLISDNPDNPRNHLRNLQETVDNVREVGVLLPIVVATVDAYLANRPSRAGELQDGAKYLVIDGHRRLEAARRVGLATIPVRVDDARVATDEALLEAAFVANYHRDDMTDLEEANALQQLVDFYGSQTKAAKRLGMPQATLSTKLSLLKLSPELQADLVTGARRVEHVRNLGKLSAEEQKKKADQRAQETARKAPSKKVADAAAANYHAVIIPDGDEPTGTPDKRPTTEPAVPAEPAGATEEEVVLASPEPAVPEPRDADTQEDRGRWNFPYNNVTLCLRLLNDNMTPENRQALARQLLEDAPAMAS